MRTRRERRGLCACAAAQSRAGPTLRSSETAHDTATSFCCQAQQFSIFFREIYQVDIGPTLPLGSNPGSLFALCLSPFLSSVSSSLSTLCISLSVCTSSSANNFFALNNLLHLLSTKHATQKLNQATPITTYSNRIEPLIEHLVPVPTPGARCAVLIARLGIEGRREEMDCRPHGTASIVASNTCVKATSRRLPVCVCVRVCKRE